MYTKIQLLLSSYMFLDIYMEYMTDMVDEDMCQGFWPIWFEYALNAYLNCDEDMCQGFWSITRYMNLLYFIFPVLW